MKNVISLYDYTGEAVKPWAEAGYACWCYDIQHEEGDDFKTITFDSGGTINFVHADLHSYETMCALGDAFKDQEVAFAMAFPVCTDLAVSGAKHFAKKEEADPGFQTKAARYAEWCGELFDNLGVPYFIENPVSRLATLWRKPNHSFHPFEYGGYIPEGQAAHPKWPEYIPQRDAYSKKTCLWAGGGFVMPQKKPVECDSFGTSQQFRKLGGKSMKTKNIRSATPRGFATAAFMANCINEG